eukprot:1656204-Prorocentrum_lima.AAC.1
MDEQSMAMPPHPATGFAGTGIMHAVEAGTTGTNSTSAGCWSSCHLGRHPALRRLEDAGESDK